VTIGTSGPATLRLTLEDTGYPFDGSSNLQVDSQIQNLAFTATGGSTLNSSSWVNTNPLAVPDLGSEQTTIGALSPIGTAAMATGHVATVAELNTASVSIGGVPGNLIYGEATSSVFAATGPFSLFTQLVLDL